MQWTAKDGITASAPFNYQILPELTTELSYKKSQLHVKNCIGIYQQWAKINLELYAWYTWRGW